MGNCRGELANVVGKFISGGKATSAILTTLKGKNFHLPSYCNAEKFLAGCHHEPEGPLSTLQSGSFFTRRDVSNNSTSSFFRFESSRLQQS